MATLEVVQTIRRLLDMPVSLLLAWDSVGPYGVYHAMQDNFYWMEHFGDPTFQYQAAMAQIWGHPRAAACQCRYSAL